MVAALTFDDGPDPQSTVRFLDTLDRHLARATFFMIGQRAAASPSLVREVVRRGHAIANHTWDHSTFTAISSAERRRQLKAVERELKPHVAKLFRPPRGHMSPAARSDLLLLRYTPVTWNVDIDDWRSSDVEAMTYQLVAGVRPGCIVLLHDSIWEAGSAHSDRGPLLECLDAALSRLSDYRFVTLPELFQIGKPVASPWSYDG